MSPFQYLFGVEDSVMGVESLPLNAEFFIRLKNEEELNCHLGLPPEALMEYVGQEKEVLPEVDKNISIDGVFNVGYVPSHGLSWA